MEYAAIIWYPHIYHQSHRQAREDPMASCEVGVLSSNSRTTSVTLILEILKLAPLQVQRTREIET